MASAPRTTSHCDLAADTAPELARYAVDALDHIPEKVR
jgi:hypothetical protein